MSLHFFSRLKLAKPQTPPILIRAVVFMCYTFSFMLGLTCLVHPFASPERALEKSRRFLTVTKLNIFVYFMDTVFATSPLNWCCMRSIAPFHVVKHHVPYLFGMMFISLAFLVDHENTVNILVQRPSLILFSVSVCITSSNEALWVASSFFTLRMLNNKVYKVGQKLLALSMLTQVIVLGSICSCVLNVQLGSDLINNQENRTITFFLMVPSLIFFFVAYFVQVPLWYNVYNRLLHDVTTHEE